MQRLGDRSRMSGDVHVRFCESPRGKFPRATRLLILCQSKSAAENALNQASRYLEEELLLTVNQEKTHISHSLKGIKFLGVCIHSVTEYVNENETPLVVN